MSASSSSRPIVLDDTDPSIRYSGSGWFLDGSGGNDNVGNFGPTYMHTVHGTHVNGQISLNFSGTSIRILGTNPSQNISNPMVDWECFIDGSSIGREPLFVYPENSWVFCKKENLSETLHSFSMDVQVKSSAYTFWIDQLQYTPSADVSRNNSTVLIPNDDLALQYDSSWRPLGGHKAITQTGATVYFNFTGTSVSWYGYTPTEFSHTPSTAFYSIDDGRETKFIVTGLPDNSPSIYNQLFFTAQGLTQVGQRSLRVTYSGASGTIPLTLGYLLVKNDTSASETLSTPPPSSSPSSPPALPESSGSAHNGKVGPIVGGVVGGAAALFLVAAAIFWVCRRKAHLKKSGSQPEVDIMPFAIAPTSRTFPPPTSRIIDKESPSSDNLHLASAAQGPIARRSNAGTIGTKNRRANGISIQPLSPGTTGATDNLSGAEFHTVQHLDSGLRVQCVDIPPYYTPT